MNSTARKAAVFFLLMLLSIGMQAQLLWTANLDSINSFSSPRVEDLNDDGIDDVVIGGGLENR